MKSFDWSRPLSHHPKWVGFKLSTTTIVDIRGNFYIVAGGGRGGSVISNTF
jgi:hypothetical protein